MVKYSPSLKSEIILGKIDLATIIFSVEAEDEKEAFYGLFAEAITSNASPNILIAIFDKIDDEVVRKGILSC